MSESPGTLIGRSNIRTEGGETVTALSEPDADTLDHLRMIAVRALEGREAFIHDAVFNGRRVRLYSNSHHLADFWRECWLSEAEWASRTGLRVERDPVVTLYAMIRVPDQAPSRLLAGTDGFLFNTSRYDALRELCLQALAAADLAVRRGSVVESGGRMRVFPGPAGETRATGFWETTASVDSRFVAEDAYVVDGDGRACPIERRICVSPAFVGDYPEHASVLLRAKFENVPSAEEADPDRGRVTLQRVMERDPSGALGRLPADRAEEFLARVLASPAARVVLDPAALFGASSVVTSPVALPEPANA